MTMDFYIIELKDRLKIGISSNIENRVTSILSSGGHTDSDILNLFKFPDSGIIEAPLKRLFRPCLLKKSKYNRGEEWFYKKGLVGLFINEIKTGVKPSIELIEKIQHKYADMENGYKQQAIFIFEKIKKERKNIGFPNSITFESFIKKKKIAYRHMIYWINDDFTQFTREPKFEIESINKVQEIQCLRIIKNNTICNLKKEKIQSYIDDVFNGINNSYSDRFKIIEKYFFNSTKIQKVENPNIRILFDKKRNNYQFRMPYSKLTKEEYVLIKESKDTTLFLNEISFQYKYFLCYCKFENKEIARVRNLLKKVEYTDSTGKVPIRISKVMDELPIQKYRPMKRQLRQY
jgi:hypothetical protein